jgi:hypothetical protein
MYVCDCFVDRESVCVRLGQIFTFDCTIGPYPSKRPSYVTFHPWCLTAADGNERVDPVTNTVTSAMLSFPTIMQRLEHSTITVLVRLKMTVVLVYVGTCVQPLLMNVWVFT